MKKIIHLLCAIFFLTGCATTNSEEIYLPLLETNNQYKQQRDFYLQSEDSWSHEKIELGILFLESWFNRDNETVYSLFSQPMQAIMLDYSKQMNGTEETFTLAHRGKLRSYTAISFVNGVIIHYSYEAGQEIFEDSITLYMRKQDDKVVLTSYPERVQNTSFYAEADSLIEAYCTFFLEQNYAKIADLYKNSTFDSLGYAIFESLQINSLTVIETKGDENQVEAILEIDLADNGISAFEKGKHRYRLSMVKVDRRWKINGLFIQS